MKVENNKQAIDILYDIVLTTFITYGCDSCHIDFNKELKYGHGYLETSSDFETLHKVSGICIGVGGMDMTVLDLRQLTVLSKTVFHELGHAKQEYRHKNEDSQEMYYMGLTYIACLLYEDYYRDRYNYFHNIKEIDAEFNGIKGAHYFISSITDDLTATKYVVDYINVRVNKYQKNPEKFYYIDVSHRYNNMTDIYKAFAYSIVMSHTCHRHCDFWQNSSEFFDIYNESNGTQQDLLLVERFFNNDVSAARQIKLNTIALNSVI